MQNKVTLDIALIGGGITGLWALNRLRKLGYSVALFENRALGAGQTLKSQGIIHGGIKYTLTGLLSKSAQSIADMPKRWQACLQGSGEINLSPTRILSSEQLLWSTGGLTSDLTTFFASKALKSRVHTLNRKDFPVVLQPAAFKGHVYRLNEVVLDVPSLIQTLSSPHIQSLFKIDGQRGCRVQHDDHHIQSLHLHNNSESVEVIAKRYMFAAGEGNANLLQALPKVPKMQCRPLQMVLVKMPEHLAFYAHCIDHGVNPRVTITTHTAADGQNIWYIGGQIAEEGVSRSPEAQCQFAKQELKQLFPWLQWDAAQFASFFVNRAEGEMPNGARPDSFFLQPWNNAAVAWPTKLALAPLLCDQFIADLEKDNILPSASINMNALDRFEKPIVATPIWDTLFQSSIKN